MNKSLHRKARKIKDANPDAMIFQVGPELMVLINVLNAIQKRIKDMRAVNKVE